VKRTVIVLAAIITLIATVPNAHAIGVYGQWWDAIGDGFGIGVKQAFLPKIPLVKLDGRVAWLNFSDASTDVVPFEVTGSIGGLFYAGVGVGYYLVMPDQGDNDNQIGTSLQVGVEFAPVKLGGFAEARYTWLSDSSYLDGTNLIAGVIWKF
jgi:hypothetical protein